MHHDTPLISTLVTGLVLAFILGAVAQRIRISPLVGYLLAGILIGPFTPGYVADQKIADQLAEIGVILLMFGVGLHFSLDDLLKVKAIAIPGAIVQIAVATALGMGLAHLMGWPLGAGLVFGLALSVASTVVLLRALQERRLVETERGRIAVGWLIVEDIAMVLALVLLPVLAGYLEERRDKVRPGTNCCGRSRSRSAKVAAFVVDHADGRPSRDPLDHALRRPYRLARIVPACGAGDRARRRLRRRRCCSTSRSRSARSSPA